jgi:15-cis-phytoene synthase
MLQPSFDIGADEAVDIAACRVLLKNGSKTFYAASFFLPRRVREPATALYAFCRLADDAVDMGGDAIQVLDDLKKRMDLAYAGQPFSSPADRAFAGIVRRFAIPMTVPQALIEGFVWDFEHRRYETLQDLEAYAARVAGTVGVMMAMVMGTREPDALARACDLGIAMQLTNIARDVGEDAARGRLYLPTAWLEEAGIDPQRFLEKPVFDKRMGTVVARLLAEAERLYCRSEQGLAFLPRECRSGIRAARLLYAEIGAHIARQGYDSVSRRAVVPISRKLVLLARAYATRGVGVPIDDEVVVHAARFLTRVPAVTFACSTDGAARQSPAWWNFVARISWVIELFDRLERCERQSHGSGAHAMKPTGMDFAPDAR